MSDNHSSQDIRELNERLCRIEKACERMHKHIEFVDSIIEYIASRYHSLLSYITGDSEINTISNPKTLQIPFAKSNENKTHSNL